MYCSYVAALWGDWVCWSRPCGVVELSLENHKKITYNYKIESGDIFYIEGETFVVILIYVPKSTIRRK